MKPSELVSSDSPYMQMAPDRMLGDRNDIVPGSRVLVWSKELKTFRVGTLIKSANWRHTVLVDGNTRSTQYTVVFLCSLKNCNSALAIMNEIRTFHQYNMDKITEAMNAL